MDVAHMHVCAYIYNSFKDNRDKTKLTCWSLKDTLTDNSVLERSPLYPSVLKSSTR